MGFGRGDCGQLGFAHAFSHPRNCAGLLMNSVWEAGNHYYKSKKLPIGACRRVLVTLLRHQTPDLPIMTIMLTFHQVKFKAWPKFHKSVPGPGHDVADVVRSWGVKWLGLGITLRRCDC